MGRAVPTPHAVNCDAEAAEDAAYAEMDAAKQRLRDHICELYGISATELTNLVR
jgi:hypothetical protein